MADLDFKHQLTVTGTLTLNEDELGALDAIAGYNVDTFLKVFYEKMGESYLRRHEAGLRSLFKKVRDTVPGALSTVQAARRMVRVKS